MCGGTAALCGPQSGPAGLSPRVRGNPAYESGKRVPRWSIPACAGEPRRRPLPEPAPAVYPRVCGGTDTNDGAALTLLGLSPRVRGNLSHRQQVSAVLVLAGGLSPRVRGNRQLIPFHRPNARSIPACAGEPYCYPIKTQIVWVYPRVCGGTRIILYDRTGGGGLSPRVRGNLVAPPLRAPGRRVYPRVCGGTRMTPNLSKRCLGLSPRVRGNPRPPSAPLGRSGSIPACAGEPGSITPRRNTGRVYPRVCGGTPVGGGWAAARAGLSPRVRGNRSSDSTR